MFNKVRDIRPLKNLRLLVSFQNGETKFYDVAPLLEKWESFKALALPGGLFEAVKVDLGGYGISWNDEIDLSCDELYFNGTNTN